MAKILQQNAPILHTHAEPVNPKDFGSPRLKKILNDMRTALEKEEDGVAIAAPQIGVPLRIFVVSRRVFEMESAKASISPDTIATSSETKREPAHDMIFINPEVIKLSRKKNWMPEGCLSVRWLYGEVARASNATVHAYDEHGTLFTRGAGGLLAQIFQHEVDHLNGMLFIDVARHVERVTKEEMERQKHAHK